MSEDPLQLCPVEKWDELEQIFETDLPRSISGIILLQIQRHLLQNGIDHGNKLYCPYGNGKYGLVALFTKKGLFEVAIQCPSDDTSKLEDALKTTSIIDWNKEAELPFLPKHLIHCIERVTEGKNVVPNLIAAIPYILDKSSTLFNVTLPPGFSFELLSLEHVDLLSSTWPHRFEGCSLYFELSIKAKLGYGLFKDQRLVSWVLVRESGPLLHLFTLEEERRKGYGELTLKLISNFLLQGGKHVSAFCKADNITAAQLYEKLNFQRLSDVDWCLLTKK